MQYAPVWMQNIGISLFNSWQYKIRHSGEYKNKFIYFRDSYNALSADDLEKIQKNKLDDFLRYASEKSEWYKGFKSKNLADFPILEKEDILKNLEKIKTTQEKDGLVSLTGGTTGASMKVIYTKSDMQERFAILDAFRAQHGYSLGKKTAWFSGKNLTRSKDIEKGVVYRDDYINKIRFFSTFDINERNFEFYWNALRDLKPEFIVGFPSSVYELCLFAKNKNYVWMDSPIKVFFPTAETVLDEYRKVIHEILGCKIIDQYASSEGAPFILECNKGKMHLNSLSGIFELIDPNNSDSGELLVTSFTTHGTPLIRYRVGDCISLAPQSAVCDCGSQERIVVSIDGRTSDFIFSEEKGKVNLGNISNCTKDAKGIICFQIIQNTKQSLEIYLVTGNDFDEKQMKHFDKAMIDRVGTHMSIKYHIVDNIPKEKSGKFRIVKNNIGKI